MTPERNRRDVENRLQESLKMDRARVQVGRISRFGLLEMSRQRLRPALGETSSLVCPRCRGTGNIRNVPSIALHVLRLIQEEAMKENTAAVHVHLPVETATYLLNEKRHEMSQIESRLGTPIMVVAAPELETPHYHIRRLRLDEYEEEADIPSYELEIVEEEEEEAAPTPSAAKVETPVIGPLTHTAAPPAPMPKKQGFWARLFAGLFGGGGKVESKPAAKPAEHRPRPPFHRERDQRGHHRHEHRRQGQHEGARPRPQQPGAGGQPTPSAAGGGQQGQPRGGERQEGGGRRRRRRRGGRGGRPQEQQRGNQPEGNSAPRHQQEGNVRPPDQSTPESSGAPLERPQAETSAYSEAPRHDVPAPPPAPAPAAAPAADNSPSFQQVETKNETTTSS
jgi:ribonuclease E